MKVLFALLLSVLAAVSAYLVALSVWGISMAFIAAKWPVSDGVILTSRVEKGCGLTHDGFRYELNFSYSVANAAFEGNTLSFNHRACGEERWANAFASRYPVGAEVSVHVDPENPNNATLIAGNVRFYDLLALAIMAFMAVVFTAGAVESIRFAMRGWSRSIEGGSTDATVEDFKKKMSGHSIFDPGDRKR